MLSRYDEARQHYQEAIRVCTEMRFRPELALSHLQLAELLLEHYPAEKKDALDSSTMGDVKAYGKPAKEAIKTRLMQIGPVAYELIEPAEGRRSSRSRWGERRGRHQPDLRRGRR